MFGKLKNKVIGRSDDIGELSDIRSHVIGEDDYNPPQLPPEPPAATAAGVPEMTDVPRPGREPIGLEAPSSDMSFTREPPRESREPFSVEGSDVNRNYDIIDKLNMIEAQLSAIRSQTETINERLKNLEMRVGRRY